MTGCIQITTKCVLSMFIALCFLGILLSYWKFSSTHEKMIITSAKIVIIAAYLRTGSTFLGGMFHHHPETFYLFEPIHLIFDNLEAARNTTELMYVSGEKRRLTAGGSHENIILQDIHNWLSCNFQEIDIDTLVDRFHLFYNDSMNDFFKCASDHVYKLRILRSNAAYNHDKAKTRNSNNTLITRNLEAINNCLSKAKQNCSEAHLRVIKFVRLRMSLIAKLLPLNHNMKVVYLQRDPRGSFSSRAIAGLIKGGPSTFRMDVINHCNASLEDIGTVKLLAKRYPGRIKAVLYEDVAESPIETLQSIFTFCDLNFSSDMRNYTLSLTSLGSNDSCAYCIKRGNSTETAYKWRKKMPFTNVNFIDKQCSEVYKILGYKKFSRLINLRNVSLTTRTSSRLIL